MQSDKNLNPALAFSGVSSQAQGTGIDFQDLERSGTHISLELPSPICPQEGVILS